MATWKKIRRAQCYWNLPWYSGPERLPGDFCHPFTEKVPRGKNLSEQERAQIRKLKTAKISGKKISKHLDRSRNVVLRYMKSPENYRDKKRCGRKSRLTNSRSRLLIRGAQKGKPSARDLVQNLSVPLRVKRVKTLLRSESSIEWLCPNKGPWLTANHIKSREQWALVRVGKVSNIGVLLSAQLRRSGI